MAKILVVEDDKELNFLVVRYLDGCGYEVKGCLNASEAFDAMEKSGFDAIVSDIMLPGMDGFEFIEEVRSSDEKIPVLFMSARDDMAAKEKGFSIGIDDYIVKPFRYEELSLRIGALLRRAKIDSGNRIVVGNLVMDKEEHTAYVDGEELNLTVREFDLLYKFLSYPQKAFSRSRLMEEFWGYDSSASSRTVDVYMVKLREKTAKCDGFEIVTVHGLGYKAVLK